MLKEGQVLWIRGRVNNHPGDYLQDKHPYIIIEIDSKVQLIEVVLRDSIDEDGNKLFKAYLQQNKFISHEGETVFNKDGFAQLDTTIHIEMGDYLEDYRLTEDCLSQGQLTDLKREYTKYHLQNIIFDNKTILMTKSEIISHNKGA